MFGHLPEFFIVLVIGLIVFGPEKLPEVAASAGKMVREVRQALDVSMNPQDVEVPTDFSSYYYDSVDHAREGAPDEEEFDFDSADSAAWETDATVEGIDPDVPGEMHDDHGMMPSA